MQDNSLQGTSAKNIFVNNTFNTQNVTPIEANLTDCQNVHIGKKVQIELMVF